MGFIITLMVAVLVCMIYLCMASTPHSTQTATTSSFHRNHVSKHSVDSDTSDTSTRSLEGSSSDFLGNSNHNSSTFENVSQTRTYRDVFTETPVLLSTSSNGVQENNTQTTANADNFTQTQILLNISTEMLKNDSFPETQILLNISSTELPANDSYSETQILSNTSTELPKNDSYSETQTLSNTSTELPKNDSYSETQIQLNSSSTEMPENDSYTTTGFVNENIIDENHYMEKISTPIAAVVGITGNTATIIALQGEPFNTIPSSSILVSLAVADSVTLILIQFNKEFVINLIGYDVRAISREACKIFNFSLRFSKMLSAWCVVLVSLERFVAICLPFRTKMICTKANALKGIGIVIAVAASYCSVWTLNSELHQSVCHPSFSTPETELRERIIIIIGSTLIGILPMAILTIVTPIMCVVLVRLRRVRTELSSTHTPDVATITCMLIALCFTYVFLQIPLIIAHNVASARGENLYTTDYLPLVMLNKIGTILEAINYSCNFFIYIVCNQIFRRKVASFCFCCLRNRYQSKRISIASNDFDSAISMISAERVRKNQLTC